MINSLDTILRGSPDCGVILSGDVNQFKDTFLRTRYGYEQLVKTATRNSAILNKMWSNMSPVYGLPSVIDELGTSDHKTVLLVPAWYPTLDTGMVQNIVTRRMGKTERAVFISNLAQIRWGYFYTLPRNSLRFSKKHVDHLLDICCPFKTVTHHSTDKPWVTDGFRHLIRQRQRARMVGDVEQAKRLRNQVNREAPKLRRQFDQSKIASIEATSSRDWWKYMKTLLGNSLGGQNEMLRLANAFTGGDMDTLVNRMNECFVSISEDLPRLRATHPIFDIKEPLPAKFTINVSDTKLALDNIKVNKATGPDGIPPWALKEFTPCCGTGNCYI